MYTEPRKFKSAPKTALDDPYLHKDLPGMQKILDQQKKRREAYKRRKDRERATSQKPATSQDSLHSGVCRTCSTLRSISGGCNC